MVYAYIQVALSFGQHVYAAPGMGGLYSLPDAGPTILPSLCIAPPV